MQKFQFHWPISKTARLQFCFCFSLVWLQEISNAIFWHELFRAGVAEP